MQGTLVDVAPGAQPCTVEDGVPQPNPWPDPVIGVVIRDPCGCDCWEHKLHDRVNVLADGRLWCVRWTDLIRDGW